LGAREEVLLHMMRQTDRQTGNKNNYISFRKIETRGASATNCNKNPKPNNCEIKLY
jgi:hypothetical protein